MARRGEKRGYIQEGKGLESRSEAGEKRRGEEGRERGGESERRGASSPRAADSDGFGRAVASTQQAGAKTYLTEATAFSVVHCQLVFR